MTHIMQSSEWGKFKTKMGTPAIKVGGIQYTKHKIPFTNNYYAYAPKVNPNKINWLALEKSLKENNCINLNFDVPNILEGSKKEGVFKSKCVKAPRDTFATANVLLDISKPKEELLKNMHKKHRYNIRYAERNDIKVRVGTTKKDLDIFYKLLDETAKREKFYAHSKEYFEKLWESLRTENKEIAHIVIAEHKREPLTAWMVFTYDGVLYYPYGGSTTKKRNLQHSMAAAWAAIELGKDKGCKTFDMWGAAEDPKDKSDPWYGFTRYKMKFGGKHVKYANSYDYVIDKTMYQLFNNANKLRWKILNFIK